ncbi:HAD-IIB family hydrolase [Psychromarinibacter sp. C21-152]|uniref:HAD-IIB family hydrolase n=1 Tax=Psychromarinibacter sediminicola TaxID=3033385 RepID=A0AAE3NR45_9RHOB|nr:HAD-IIB family hydrolase [Psychromarinibacter sediminicola]MDF0600949.1 HAD-IIB family hydrolase [Psychromarinibacter sediminicola]
MQLVVFTDLDGTLLDHATYSHAAAAPALAELRRRRIPLVLASSKTAAEIAPLHAELGLGAAPAIVENGAGLLEPAAPEGGDAAEYARIRAALDAVPPGPRARYRGFGDMSDAEVAELTGLSREEAARARRRCHSEPGLWAGSEADRAAFEAALAERGIHARAGGRFLTLSLGRTKADAMRAVAARLGAETTVALGDAPNDAEMLAAADYAVVVRNDHAPPVPPLPEKPAGRIRRTDRPGPEGWNAAVLGLLEEIGG